MRLFLVLVTVGTWGILDAWSRPIPMEPLYLEARGGDSGLMPSLDTGPLVPSTTSGGRPERAGLLARAAVAAGVHALFIETHPDPPHARSDASTVQPLSAIPDLLSSVQAIRGAMTPASPPGL